MAELSLALLGPPIVERDGTRVAFDTKKAIALLAVLAVTGRDQSRDRLAALLWPESDTTRARGSLRRTLSVTAAGVGEGLAITRAAVGLRPERMRVDVADFGALAARPDLASLERAARLYDDVRAGRLEALPGPAVARKRPAGQAPGPREEARSGEEAARPASTGAAAGQEGEPGQRVTGPAGRAADGTWPIVGRTAELGILGAAWREVSAGRAGGQVAAVTGEAGCGKTALIEKFRAGLDPAGGIVLRGRCHDGESGLPFALTADLLRSAGAASPGLADRLPAHVAAMVGRLAPELAAEQPPAQAPPLSSPLALARLYAAIRSTLQLAAAPAGQPGVLIVEDVHWADRPSLDLLAYLVRRLSGWPVLLVLSWRPEHSERLRGLHAAVTEAGGSGRARTVEPRLLSAAEVSEVLFPVAPWMFGAAGREAALSSLAECEVKLEAYAARVYVEESADPR